MDKSTRHNRHFQYNANAELDTYVDTYAGLKYRGRVNIFSNDQDQDSLLVKRRNDSHSPGPVIRELVPSSHQRSEPLHLQRMRSENRGGHYNP